MDDSTEHLHDFLEWSKKLSKIVTSFAFLCIYSLGNNFYLMC